jgi:hypothetical protein
MKLRNVINGMSRETAKALAAPMIASSTERAKIRAFQYVCAMHGLTFRMAGSVNGRGRIAPTAAISGSIPMRRGAPIV